MIPKKIHYCWLSGDEFPESIKKYMNTWKEFLPDYEFILWDTNRFPLEKSKWVKQAFESKKYAFAADYIRLYAVYNEGGIYMDTDIEVVKSFDPLLHLPYFLGSEGNEIIEAGIFGAEKGAEWLKPCIDYYNDKSFIKEDGSFDTWTLPRIMNGEIEKLRTIRMLHKPNPSREDFTNNPEIIYLFERDFFCAKNQGSGVITKTENTFTVHHFAMSWLSKKRTFLPNLKRKFISIVGPGPVNKAIKFLGLKKIKIISQNKICLFKKKY